MAWIDRAVCNVGYVADPVAMAGAGEFACDFRGCDSDAIATVVKRLPEAATQIKRRLSRR